MSGLLMRDVCCCQFRYVDKAELVIEIVLKYNPLYVLAGQHQQRLRGFGELN
jgi:hypothetical protein